MKHLGSLFVAAAICLAPADMARAAGSEYVAEVVTFTLVEGSDEAAFLSAASAMEPFLKSTGALVQRSLSKGQDGQWTDYIVWTSMEAAKSAAAAMMEQPEAGPFMQMINPEGMVMKHDVIKLLQN